MGLPADEPLLDRIDGLIASGRSDEATAVYLRSVGLGDDVVLNGEGHAANVSAPELLAEKIIDFVHPLGTPCHLAVVCVGKVASDAVNRL